MAFDLTARSNVRMLIANSESDAVPRDPDVPWESQADNDASGSSDCTFRAWAVD
jgi:hypothetical protein